MSKQNYSHFFLCFLCKYIKDSLQVYLCSSFDYKPFAFYWNSQKYCTVSETQNGIIWFEIYIFLHGLNLIKSKYEINAFSISNTFIRNTRLRLAKHQAIAKHQPEAKLLLFQNYSLSSSMLSSKNGRAYSKKCARNQACLS